MRIVGVKCDFYLNATTDKIQQQVVSTSFFFLQTANETRVEFSVYKGACFAMSECHLHYTYFSFIKHHGARKEE